MLASTNTAATVVADCNDVENAAAAVCSDEENGDCSPSADCKPLCQSSRAKGYILLLVSASLNFEAVSRLTTKQEYFENKWVREMDWCIVLDNISSFYDFVLLKHGDFDTKIRYAMAASGMTIIISGFVLLCYFDQFTRLKKTVWPKVRIRTGTSFFVISCQPQLNYLFPQQMFGPNKTVELCILIFLVILWMVTIWLNTSIRGIAGEGNEQYNLYFTSWLCLWTSFWTMERWFVSSGKSSFETFVSSWPNRCKLWIITLILSFSNFVFVLDAVSRSTCLTCSFPRFLADHVFTSRGEIGMWARSPLTMYMRCLPMFQRLNGTFYLKRQ